MAITLFLADVTSTKAFVVKHDAHNDTQKSSTKPLPTNDSVFENVLCGYPSRACVANDVAEKYQNKTIGKWPI